MTRFADRRTYIEDIAQASKPVWAIGCGKCKHGLIDPPPITCADTSLYLVRTYQAANHCLEFCECQAGQAYRNYLRGRYKEVQDGRDHIPADMAQALHDAVTTPSVHYEVAR
jgi:hypothetical protein